ncbi:MAG: serine/threonine protein kinase [Myxococcales bacterium]|nr:serine/threonine protein kinase [Myxococcales bacterium]
MALFGNSSLSKRVAGALAVAAFAAAGYVGLADLERGAAHSRAHAQAERARQSVQEALDREVLGLELAGHNAASSPRLVAAVRANVSPSTLRDIFETESWWQPYREAFPSQGLAEREGTANTLMGTKLEGPALDRLVARARRDRKPAGGLIDIGSRAFQVVAAPMLLTDAATIPVLLLARPFALQSLEVLARAANATVALYEGERLRAAAGRSAAPARTSPNAFPTVTSRLPLDGLLALVVTPNEVAPDRRWTLGMAGARAGLCLLATLLALWILFRRRPEPLVPTTAPIDDAVGRYALLNKIGGGGMADVYLAVARGEQGFRRPCVVKRLRAELASDAQVVAQFTDEATLASSLVHSHIVPIFDFGRLGDHYFIVQEYVAGRDLGKLSARLEAQHRPPLPPAAVAHMACAVLSALDYAHNKCSVEGRPLALVHRDVTPENIMVSLQGEVKLLDFGVLKSSEGRSTKTEMGALKGSVSFMSPEQARCVEVDARADLYSLALVMYFCLTGRALFEGTASYQILVKAGAGVGPEEDARLRCLPAAFVPLLCKALAPRLDDRFQTAREFAEACKPLSAGGDVLLRQIVSELFDDEILSEQELLREGLKENSQTFRSSAALPPGTGTLTDSHEIPALTPQVARRP